MDLIERIFQRVGSPCTACNDRSAFFTSDDNKNNNLWSCQKVCEALTFLLDNIYIRFGSKLYRHIAGIRMCTYCAPLVADIFLFCYWKYFMLSFSEDNHLKLLKLSILLLGTWMAINIDNNFFDSMVNHIYPSKLQLNKANVSDTESDFRFTFIYIGWLC